MMSPSIKYSVGMAVLEQFQTTLISVLVIPSLLGRFLILSHHVVAHCRRNPIDSLQLFKNVSRNFEY